MSDLIDRYYDTGRIPEGIMRTTDKIERLEAKCAYKDEVIDQRNAMCTHAEKKIERLEAEVERLTMDFHLVAAILHSVAIADGELFRKAMEVIEQREKVDDGKENDRSV